MVSLWEVAIKNSLGHDDYQVDTRALRLRLLVQGFGELLIRSEHMLGVQQLPWIHRDPFDRLLVVQADVEGLTLLSADRSLTAYGTHVEAAS